MRNPKNLSPIIISTAPKKYGTSKGSKYAEKMPPTKIDANRYVFVLKQANIKIIIGKNIKFFQRVIERIPDIKCSIVKILSAKKYFLYLGPLTRQYVL